MTVYLLDTNIVSHIIRGDIPSVRRRLVAVPMHSVAISVITRAELHYGLAKRGNPQGLVAKVTEFLARVQTLPWTSREALAYGELRAACEAAGWALAPMDMMIAAHAKSLAAAGGEGSAVLVTRDGAFSKACAAGGLLVEDWTREDPAP